MRINGEWCDITICNVSSRGFMAKCASPPPRGTYIEVRHRSLCIVARVMWSRDLRFGVRAQDRIDIANLLSEEPAKRYAAGEERRAARRDRPVLPPGRPNTEAAAEASRRFARVFEWVTLSLAIAVAAGLVFQIVTTSLSKPMQDIKDAMSVGSRLGSNRPHAPLAEVRYSAIMLVIETKGFSLEMTRPAAGPMFR